MGLDRVSDYWRRISRQNVLASTIDPTDVRGLKNAYIAGLRDRAIERFSPHSPSNGVALDFGCGHGDLDAVLLGMGYRVIGLDITSKLLSAARQRMGRDVLYVQYDGIGLPFLPRSFDLIVSYGVLIYFDLPGSVKTLAELRGAMKPRGSAIFIEQCRRRQRVIADEEKHHWTIEQWQSRLEAAGYHVDATAICRTGHMPLLFLIRWGLWPKRWWERTMAFEQWLGRMIGIPFGDYADVAFVCSVRAD